MDDHVNLFGGSPLNRLSWLRPSHTFLNAIVVLPTTKWLLFNGGKPLTIQHSPKVKKDLGYLSTEDVKPLLGPKPYFGQGKEGEAILSDPVLSSNHSPLAAARHLGKPVVFLGLRERGNTSLPRIEDILKDPVLAVSQIDGTPFFAMEVSDLDLTTEELDGFLKNTSLAKSGAEPTWSEARGLSLGLDMENAAIFSMARSMVDWNSRRKFCPACGSNTYSMWGGWKLSCTSLLPWSDNMGRKRCPTNAGLHNFTHPRSDPVVIMVVIDETGNQILLGRGIKFPGMFYSALAGFIEPGETFEDAVRRETWEEAGIRVWDVRYHSTQPWPYPANLMVGFYARADSTQPVRTDLDNELADARWFSREEVLSILEGRNGTVLSQADYKKFAENLDGNDEGSSKATSQALTATEIRTHPAASLTNNVQTEELIKFPSTTAIAGVLIKDWAERNPRFFSGSTLLKGCL